MSALTQPESLVAGLERIVGPDAVFARPADLLVYEYDGSVDGAVETAAPAAVALPTTPDPDGFNPLHHIARCCLTHHVAGTHDRRRRILNPPGFLDACLSLWRLALAAGLDINGPDLTDAADPPLFHYLRHHDALTAHFTTKRRLGDYTCHVDHFDAFLGGADVAVRNAHGEGAGHVVAGREVWEARKLLDEHDAGLLRFLVVEKGLDILAEDAVGRTALDVAAEAGRRPVAEAFLPRKDGD